MLYKSSFVNENAKYFSSMNEKLESWRLNELPEVELLIQGQDSNPAFTSLEHTKQKWIYLTENIVENMVSQ